MKKTIGIILAVIVGLNFVSIMVRSSKGDPIGSPAYLIILVMMLFGGIGLINSAAKKKNETTDIQKTEGE